MEVDEVGDDSLVLLRVLFDVLEFAFEERGGAVFEWEFLDALDILSLLVEVDDAGEFFYGVEELVLDRVVLSERLVVRHSLRLVDECVLVGILREEQLALDHTVLLLVTHLGSLPDGFSELLEFVEHEE